MPTVSALSDAVPLYFYKSAAVGPTSIAVIQSPIKAFHFLIDFEEIPQEFLRRGYQALFIGQVSRVHDFRAPFREEKEAYDVAVLDQRFADVVNLPALVFCVGVRQERDGRVRHRPGDKVNVLARWTAPNGVKLCLDEYTGPLPNRPTRYLFASRDRRLRFHNRETFALWLLREGATNGRDWFRVRNDTSAEGQDVGRVKFGGAIHE